jgi:hypothetical protein
MQALHLPANLVGRYEDILVACELHGDNNCWTWDNKKRCRDWYPIAIGSESAVMREIVERASACCGGGMVLYGQRHTEPEAYIRRWRKALANAAKSLEEFTRRRMTFRARIRFSPEQIVNGRAAAWETLCRGELRDVHFRSSPAGGLRALVPAPRPVPLVQCRSQRPRRGVIP